MFFQSTGADLALSDLLQIEDCSEILEPRCPRTHIPLWSQLRLPFFREIMADRLYDAPLPGRSGRGAGRTAAVATMARSLAHNARMRFGGRGAAPILIKGDAVMDRWTDDGWCNRLAGPFAEATPNEATMLYDHHEWRWPFPRFDSDRAILMAPLQARHAIIGSLVGRVRRESAATLVALASQRARDLLGWEIGAARRSALGRFLARRAGALPYQFRDYGRMFDRLGTRLLMVTEGCYGPHAAMIAAARDRGIVAAEYAHGMVAAGHDAYNFAPAVLASNAYRRTLPAFLLNFGDWSNRQINAPLEKVAIGSPARSDVASARHRAEPKQTILVLSDGIDFQLYLDLAQHISRRVADIGFRVVLRPHPIERHAVAAGHERIQNGVEINGEGSIYDAFGAAAVVISEVSTGLFEAVGLVPRIWVLSTPKSRFSIPEHPFETIQDMADLDERLKCVGSAPAASFDEASIWSPNWQENYRAFLRKNDICP